MSAATEKTMSRRTFFLVCDDGNSGSLVGPDDGLGSCPGKGGFCRPGGGSDSVDVGVCGLSPVCGDGSEPLDIGCPLVASTNVKLPRIA